MILERINAMLLATMDRVRMDCLSWETIIAKIRDTDGSAAEEIDRFYQQCLRFNQPAGGQ